MPEDSKIPKMSLYMSRQRLDIGELTPEQIDIRDIAHNLTILPRFAGNTARPYSVAEHSIMVMQMVADLTDNPHILLQALLHDACEYILGDIPSPIKSLIPEIRDFEHRVLWPVICERFGLEEEMAPEVKAADWAALFVEASSLHCSDELDQWENYDKFWPIATKWIELYGAISYQHMPHPATIEHVFLNCFGQLIEERRGYDEKQRAVS